MIPAMVPMIFPILQVNIEWVNIPVMINIPIINKGTTM